MLQIQGNGSGVVGVSGSGNATVRVGREPMLLPLLQNNLLGLEPVTGTGDAVVVVTASADGVHGVAATADGSIPLAASAVGAHGVDSTAADEIVVAGDAVAEHAVEQPPQT